ncbi:hypothetical protein NA57DRAFT_75310 [Rhizodiscina lignyota]|uniref:Xylanolytic transcriptional activator regulatory domain-containing protein n=1 Tax=Rhizodiscina lignyota TaxID=1504668 RepID=A0A9P4MBJ4_9PEZI|nr:hypothetical protein NA57DRAFT_75310 [Rhizodiscina lignyota]
MSALTVERSLTVVDIASTDMQGQSPPISPHFHSPGQGRPNGHQAGAPVAGIVEISTPQGIDNVTRLPYSDTSASSIRPNGHGLGETCITTITELSPDQPAVGSAAESSTRDSVISNAVQSNSNMFSPFTDFELNAMVSFDDMAANALLQPDINLAPLLHLDHPFSDSGNSATYQDDAILNTPPAITGATQSLAASNGNIRAPLDHTKLEQAAEKPSKFSFSEDMRQDLLRDIRARSMATFAGNIAVPRASIIQACIRTYIDCFDPHLPFIHIPTLVLQGSPSPLILAMCAIGSLYRLERKVAGDFYSLAEDLISSSEMHAKPRLRRLSNVFASPRQPFEAAQDLERPIWAVQCRLLLNVFALFAWDGGLVQEALNDQMALAQEFRRRAPLLERNKQADRWPCWQSWIEAESTKRQVLCKTMCAILIVDSLSAVTYGSLPGYYYEEAAMDMPGDDRLWRCLTSAQWHYEVDARSINPTMNVEQLLAHIMNEDAGAENMRERWYSSLFAVIVAMHALNVHILHIALAAESLRVLPLNRQESMRTTFWTDMNKALNKCQRAFNQGKTESDPWQDPLLFNCLAVLRIAFMREYTDGQKSFNRRVLLSCDPTTVCTEIRAYVLSEQQRGPRVTEAVTRAFLAMMLPMRAGANLVRKTAALTWSIEHAIAWWDTGLFFTRWVYSTECLQRQNTVLHPDEDQALRKIYNFMHSESDIEPEANSPLAAAVARVWASFLDDTWVWGVTPRMAWVLREFAKFYNSHWQDALSPAA